MQTVEMIIADKSTSLNPSDLAEFLYLFTGTGRALKHLVPPSDHNALREATERELINYKRELRRFSPDQLNVFFDSQSSPEFVHITSIRRNSPLEFTLGGCALLITLGVIFSGGKISLTRQGLKAELPSLGKGIQSLRDALGLNNNLKAGFGVRETVIKLNDSEFDALCKQDDESKNRGGFQHFLVGLKVRINKQTRELRLSPSDLERIYRYKANPKRGGWQSRCKKIFGRHFPEDGEHLL
ncbi:MAG: hypothetical protein EPO07_00520 [Verrucomicrobia bacterium]|nr:MAG: hypothetical protein EPO07_00520 [Verrucomicrobiota bacterium]